MPVFANAAQFAGSRPFEAASGAGAEIVDPHGRVIGRVSTGGVISPTRHETRAGDILFRFGGTGVPPQKIALGAWWMEKASFEKVLSFAMTHGISVGMATRVLCLVPPEWSNLGTLIRAAARQPLLAYRGLGNSVVVPKSDGFGAVRLPHQNEIAARRVHQLFIPGLGPDMIAVEQSWVMDPKAAMRGFIYL